MESQKEYYVYVLEIVGTGEIFYCGKGSGRRSKTHRATAKDPNKSHYYLYRKINSLWQNGSDYQDRIVFRTYSEKEAYDKETELIASLGKENLCNLTDGGDGSSCKGHTEETKKKIGDKNRGKKHTEETLQKMKEVHTGFRFTEEQRKNIVDKIWQNEERLTHLREQAIKLAKKVRRLDSGEIFDSLKEAGKSINRTGSSISLAIKKGKPCNGVYFEYVDPSWNDKIYINNNKFEQHSEESKQKMRDNFANNANKEDIIDRLNKQSMDMAIKVRRLDTREEYESASAAAITLGRAVSSVIRAIENRTKCNGVLLERITEENSKLDIIIPIEKPKAIVRQVRRRDTGEIFPSINKAAESIGRSSSTLKIQMDKNRPCAGIVFEYLDSEPIIIDESVKPAKVAVRRTDTYEEFESIAEAAKSINRSAPTLRYAIENGTECAGIRWEYSIDNFNVNDFFELHPTCYA